MRCGLLDHRITSAVFAGAVILGIAPAASEAPRASGPPAAGHAVHGPGAAAGDGACRPFLILDTEAGGIEIELHEDAAPHAVRRLVELASGPIFNPALVAPEGGGRPPGFYDGLGFDLVRPHVEITTAGREPASAFTLRSEIDARALGLDKRLVTDPAEAMSVVQQEILVHHRTVKKRGQVAGKLAAWLDRWYEGYSADFLIGVSRREINEALGYVYQDGLASRPAVRGAVALRPESPTLSTVRLTILLADVPERTGRWVVVGSVVRGLEAADEISARPLACECTAVSTRPRHPVLIRSARIDCR